MRCVAVCIQIHLLFQHAPQAFLENHPLGEIENVWKWHNTLGFALGGEYKLNEALKVRDGYIFHEYLFRVIPLSLQFHRAAGMDFLQVLGIVGEKS
jgi:hypothetical protein